MTTYEPQAGEHIERACDNARKLAVKSGKPVSFKFNDIPVTVSPEDSTETAATRWNHDMEASAKAYRESPVGIAAAKERERELEQHQSDLDGLVATLPKVIGHADGLMGWIKRFSELADYAGTTYDKSVVIAMLTSAGYLVDMHVGQSPDWFNTRQRMREYIVGQVLECIDKFGSPHPITQTFVDKYFALPPAE